MGRRQLAMRGPCGGGDLRCVGRLAAAVTCVALDGQRQRRAMRRRRLAMRGPCGGDYLRCVVLAGWRRRLAMRGTGSGGDLRCVGRVAATTCDACRMGEAGYRPAPRSWAGGTREGRMGRANDRLAPLRGALPLGRLFIRCLVHRFWVGWGGIGERDG
jgi:hypothetical protein